MAKIRRKTPRRGRNFLALNKPKSLPSMPASKAEGRFELPNLESFLPAALLILGGGLGLGHYFSPAQTHYRQQQAIAYAELGNAELSEFRAEKAAEAAARQRSADQGIAHERYKSGCTVLAVQQEDGAYKLLAISDEANYIDTVLSVVLAEGEEVCDDNGLTGVMQADGRVGDVRRAGDMALVNKRVYDAYSGWAHTVRSTPGGLAQ